MEYGACIVVKTYDNRYLIRRALGNKKSYWMECAVQYIDESTLFQYWVSMHMCPFSTAKDNMDI